MTDSQQAEALLRSTGASVVAVRAGQVVGEGRGRGIGPLITLLRTPGEPLRGAAVADQIVGRAAAMVCLLAGAASVHGEVMSRPAAEALTEAGIPHTAATLVDMITNREGTGSCPVEALVREITSPAEAVVAVERFLAAHRK